jgi:hypothetical protein
MFLIKKIAAVGITVLLLSLAVGCTAGPHSRFVEKPAGFWAGLWHGLICVVTFIISLFNDSVKIYEVNNSGRWYDLGFILGACVALGGTGKAGWNKRRQRNLKEREWEKIGQKVEEKVRTGIREWVDESGQRDEEWEEIARKIEEKIKRKLKDWANDEPDIS